MIELDQLEVMEAYCVMIDAELLDTQAVRVEHAEHMLQVIRVLITELKFRLKRKLSELH